MIKGSELINSLMQLYEGSNQYKELDHAIDLVANKGKRLSLYDRVAIIENEMDLTYRKLFPIAFDNSVLIRSKKDPTGKIILSLESDTELSQKLPWEGIKFIFDADAAGDRCLYFEEYKQRLHILKEQILAGSLDEFLAFSSKDVIYRVMGLSGELLQLIGINPRNGDTYRRFVEVANVPEPDNNIYINAIKGTQKEIARNLARMNSNSDIADGVPLEPNLDDDVAIGRFVETGKPSMPKKAKLKKYKKK